jgi:mono/diheme cytochrome c family protein
MWKTNLKVLAVGLSVIVFYTAVAQIIPQLESEVPETLDLSGEVTPEILVAAGERLFNGAGGCRACHGLGSRAPNLLTDHAGQGSIGRRCGDRTGADCKTYLRESLTEPASFLVDGFTAIMPDARRQLSQDQIWALVAFLQSQGGEVTVSGADISATSSGGGAASTPAPSAAPASFSGTADPMQLVTENACVGCHALNGAGPPIGPPFDGMGSRLTADQIRRGILDPNAETAEGFESFAGTMPIDLGRKLSAQQLEAIVQFLVGRR